MKKILCIAQSCCDMIFGNLPRIPELGQEVYGDSFSIRPGGGANTPVNLGALGAPVTFLTGLGDDDAGRQILSLLKSSGVRVTGAIALPDTRTPVSAVLSTAKDRCFASYGGTEGPFFSPRQLEEEIQRADIVHTYLGYSIAYGIGDLALRYGKQLSLDVSWCDAENTPQVWQELEKCSYLKLNDGESHRITGLEDPREALRTLAAHVRCGAVVTLGSSGSIGLAAGEDQESIIFQEALSMGQFLDSCGAGDAYGAGLLYGLSLGKNLDQAMETGAALAGLCVTWLGGNTDKLNCTMLGKRFCTNRRKAP